MIRAVLGFYGTSVGKKVIVALTGAFMVLFLMAHMIGNLQVFEGRGVAPELTKLNQYAELLRKEIAILWGFRLALLGSVFLHVMTTIQLTWQNREARPVEYASRKWVETTPASRMMIWGGIALGLYIVYHVLHFTTGTVHGDLYTHGDVYDNVIRSFQRPWISAVYIVAQVALFFHLYHGVLSAAQTLGVSHPTYLDFAKKAGVALSLIISLGFLIVPVSVLLGFVS